MTKPKKERKQFLAFDMILHKEKGWAKKTYEKFIADVEALADSYKATLQGTAGLLNKEELDSYYSELDSYDENLDSDEVVMDKFLRRLEQDFDSQDEMGEDEPLQQDFMKLIALTIDLIGFLYIIYGIYKANKNHDVELMFRYWIIGLIFSTLALGILASL